MLQQLHDNLWIADMPASRLGFEFGARMTVVRLKSGELWIHSPIELEPFKAELDALGKIGFVVSPFRFHYMHLAEFAVAYPDAKFYAPPGLNMEKFKEVRFTGRLKDGPRLEWKDEIDQLAMKGNALDNEIVFFHKPSKSLIVADLCFNIPHDRSKLTTALAGALGVLDHMAPSRNFKIMTRNASLVRQTIKRILKWDFQRVILSHGNIVETDAKAKFREAFSYLLRGR